MTTVTIGATGTYASWAAFRTAMSGGMADDYTALIQDGTYNETMTVDWSMSTYTLYVEPVLGPSGAVIFDQQTTRTNGLAFSKGRLVVRHIEFKNSTAHNVYVTDATTTDAILLEMYGCTIRGGTDGISNGAGSTACDFKLVGCRFLDFTSGGGRLYAYVPGETIDVWGCTFLCTSVTPSLGFELAGDGTGNYGTMRGCDFFRTGNAAIGILGGGFRVENTRIRHADTAFRDQWGNSFTVLNSVVISATGAWASFWIKSANNWTISRCLIDCKSLAGCDAVYFSNNAGRAVIRNCGFVNARWGQRVLGTLTALVCNQSYNGYFNLSSGRQSGPVGTFNNPETGVQTTDPLLDSQDTAVPRSGSPWDATGTSADGLPVHNPTGTPDIGAVERYRVEVAA